MPVVVSDFAIDHTMPGTYGDQFKVLKVSVRAAACTLERLLYAQTSRAYTVRDVDDARQFLQLPEEFLGDGGAIIGSSSEGNLRLTGLTPRQQGQRDGATEKGGAKDAHGRSLSHIPTVQGVVLQKDDRMWFGDACGPLPVAMQRQ